MRGSIRKQSGDSWRITISLGKNPTTGKYDKYQETVQAKKKGDVDKRLAELINQFEKGMTINPEKISFGEYLDQWLNDYGRTNLSPTTIQGYKSIINKQLKPGLGRIPLSKLTPAHLREFYAKSLREGRKDGKTSQGSSLTANTVKHFHRLIHRVLKQAVKMEIIPRNVADAVDPPKQRNEYDKGHEISFLSEEQIKELLGLIKGTYLYIPTLIAIHTGMRLGEIMGLRWSDIDFKREVLTIRQTLQTVEREIRFRNKAKTKGSQRSVDLPKTLTEVLKKHQRNQKKDKLAMGETYQDNDLVCSLQDGSPIRPDSFASHFRNTAHRAGIKISFHGLRHTHASLLLKAGVHPKVVAERLGHSKIGITIDLYSHVMEGLGKEAASKIDEILTNKT